MVLLVAGDKTLLFSQGTCNALSKLDSVSHDLFTGLFPQVAVFTSVHSKNSS